MFDISVQLDYLKECVETWDDSFPVIPVDRADDLVEYLIVLAEKPSSATIGYTSATITGDYILPVRYKCDNVNDEVVIDKSAMFFNVTKKEIDILDIVGVEGCVTVDYKNHFKDYDLAKIDNTATKYVDFNDTVVYRNKSYTKHPESGCEVSGNTITCGDDYTPSTNGFTEGIYLPGSQITNKLYSVNNYINVCDKANIPFRNIVQFEGYPHLNALTNRYLSSVELNAYDTGLNSSNISVTDFVLPDDVFPENPHNYNEYYSVSTDDFLNAIPDTPVNNFLLNMLRSEKFDSYFSSTLVNIFFKDAFNLLFSNLLCGAFSRVLNIDVYDASNNIIASGLTLDILDKDEDISDIYIPQYAGAPHTMGYSSYAFQYLYVLNLLKRPFIEGAVKTVLTNIDV